MRIAIATLLLGGIMGWAGCFMTKMPGKSYRGPLAPLSPEEVSLRDFLAEHVDTLAGRIGVRCVGLYPKLTEAAEHIEATFTAMGYEVKRQGYEVDGRTCYNLEVEVPGATRPQEIIVVGGHYDTIYPSPGANDNATGVASTLALARLFAGEKPARTVRFVAFVNEEPPYFQTARMGSRVYARRSKERGETIVGMWSLETMGCYSDLEGSQSYPFPFSLLYPSTGNFIGFVGNVRSRAFVRDTVKRFRAHAKFPSEGGAVYGGVPGIGWSDHWSFWQEGYPALMVTDTAPFRYAHYHQASDTPEKVQFDRLARVVAGLGKVLETFANPE